MAECPMSPVSVPMLDAIPESWQGPLLRAGVMVMGHPLEYAKVLIQIGHEPVAPRQSKTLMGKPALVLPSVFQYMGHIRRQDGFLGLYRGCGPKLISLGIGSLVTTKVRESWPAKWDGISDEELTGQEKLEKAKDAALREVAEKVACAILTQPLHVCAVRCMAQFIGREHKYDNMVSAVMSIYEDNGILGFWAGIVPKIIGEVACVGMTAFLAYTLNNCILEDKSMKAWTHHISSFIASSFCYPFQVVGNCMVVSRSGLAAGYPPSMPFYPSWTDCWQHLSREKQLKRGSSLFFRYYTGPQILVGDRLVLLNKNTFRQIPKKN